MNWQISANLGRHVRSGVDAHGWLWEIVRGGKVARVVVEIDTPAWLADRLDLPADTRQALATDGRTELLKVLEHDDPPGVIRCGLDGCALVTARPAVDE
jgi:hypothetical protein